MDKRTSLMTLCLLVLCALVGCSSVQRANPLSQMHGLPPQTETDEE